MADPTPADTKRRLLNSLSRLAKARRPAPEPATSSPGPTTYAPVSSPHPSSPDVPRPGMGASPPSRLPHSTTPGPQRGTPRPTPPPPRQQSTRQDQTPLMAPPRTPAMNHRGTTPSTALVPPSARFNRTLPDGDCGNDSTRKLPGPAGFMVMDTPATSDERPANDSRSSSATTNGAISTRSPSLSTPALLSQPHKPSSAPSHGSGYQDDNLYDMLHLKDEDFNKPTWLKMIEVLGLPPYMLRETKWSDMDASVILVDPTGELHGTIQRRVMETYSNEIIVGTTLLLQNW
ncbi:hypothetical protein BJ085DRAFT_28975 [Dimargaris cristalligena]|uniref:Homologous recombination OB-fold protein OB-fold domain-containing protein n=1 Tax=Dimargaris cristalligena TaxID=215637 RepID=A0A4P9ZWK1_9FUNG|nr:hypothetical protein BJ085DRAFT_28975 [Dimargaris cristalligena]|eukprot:RKP38045.1 hypothetical protein BJ085DRAFT_28975 [Dimargaris cristalligena]